MRKQTVWMIAPVAAAAVLAAACGGGAEKPAAGTGTAAAGTTKAAASASATAKVDPNTLAAKKASPGSLAVDDPAWNGAPVMKAQMELIKGTKPTEAGVVEAQALYSDTDVWFRFQWADTTEDRGRPYIYDGSKWALSARMTDRLSLLWPIGTITGFEAKGCYAACHREGSDDKATAIDAKTTYMILPKAGDKADNWQWTGESSAPVGQVDDLRFEGALADPKVLSSAIVKDKLDSGGPLSNAVPTPGVGPAKMQDPAKKATYGAAYLAAADAIAIDPSKFKAGDKVPRRLAAPWVGSEGDIDSKASYAAGKWTVVMHRKLDTKNADDIKFEAGKSYLFEIAVWDGIDHENHTIAKDVYTLTLK
ncbi:MAG: ethylbenzene dehydrogenase-related protein [Dehalococcoidia bacterium]